MHTLIHFQFVDMFQHNNFLTSETSFNIPLLLYISTVHNDYNIKLFIRGLYILLVRGEPVLNCWCCAYVLQMSHESLPTV